MSFQIPRKSLLTPEQLVAFETSDTRQKITAYIERLNKAVSGLKLTDDCPQSKVRFQPACHLGSLSNGTGTLQGVKSLMGILDSVEEIARETPPVENSASRFGNPAFRTFYDRVVEVYMHPPSSYDH